MKDQDSKDKLSELRRLAELAAVEKCLEELLKINPDVKVIVSTGHSLDARERLFLGALARGFVNKPYEVGQMVQAVKRVLDAGGPVE